MKIKVAAETGGGDETTTLALFANKKAVLFGVPGAFTPTCSAMGLELDFGANGMGRRNKRYAAVIENGVIQSIDVEEPGKFEVSSAEAVLNRL